VKRAILAFVGTVAGLVILLGYKTAPAHQGSRPAALAPAPPQQTPGHSRSSAPAAPRRKPTAPPVNKTVTGAAVQTPYGPVQVRVTISNGKPAGITPVQMPNDNPHSQQISNYAAPLLQREALKAGSAHIDIVSGATYTSDGYAQSLQSALTAHG
jgi:uncharacterized protein with FMN-binding domain